MQEESIKFIDVEQAKVERLPSGIFAEALRSAISEVRLKYGVIHFALQRMYEDRSSFLLTTHPEFNQIYLSRKFYQKAYTAPPSEYQRYNFLWDSTPENEIIKAIGEHSHLGHGLTLVRPNKNYCDIWFFAGEVNNPSINQVYINGLDSFERFTEEFLLKYSSTLNQAAKIRLIGERFYQDEILLTQTAVVGTHSIQQRLTEREQECCRFLMQGLTAKQIGKEIHISPRTVEKHFDNIRNKLDLKSQKLNVQLLKIKQQLF